MSNIKNKVGLKATKISFTEFSIIYDVEFDRNFKLIHPANAVIVCPDDIAEKELILKPTMIAPKMRVIYTPSNMTPHYFQDLLNKSLRNYEEHKVDIKNYYVVGDIVGYIYH